MVRISPRLPLAPLVLLVVGAGACHGVSHDRIGEWKAAPDGDAKLLAAVKDASVDTKLRAEAAAALVDRNAIDPMASAISSVPGDERAPIIVALVPMIAGDLGSG